MRISSSTVFALLAHSRFVSAAPAKGCNPVDKVYPLLKGSLQLKASSICLSILGGDNTVSQTRVTDVEITNTVRITTTQFVYAPDPTSTQYTIAPTPIIYQKRDLKIQLLPKLASSQISSACSCIATPSTYTVFVTQTSTVLRVQATVTAPGATITATVTKTLQIAVQDVQTATLPATGVVVKLS